MANFAIVNLVKGGFGGAEKRFIQLFQYLSHTNKGLFYYIITYDLYMRILKLFPDLNTDYLIPIGNKSKSSQSKATTTIRKENNSSTLVYAQEHPDFPKQVYRFLKNHYYQKKYFNEIEKIRKEKNIKVFLGIYSGIIPLYFYLKQKKRDVGIIFCDMDSWFRDIVPKEKKYWYRRYSSFNYALENSDYVDFLSPFVLKGVRERGIVVPDEAVSITPCSFTDYSKCKIGDKNIFQVAFAGRLEKDKNPEMFLDAAEKLSEKYPEIVFHIMGEGRLTGIIENRVGSLNNKNIIFHGFHPNPPEILAQTSVFVSIQSTNNYPSQSVLEAMACGNAIIATDVGDTRMFINEKNGILIKSETNALCDAIEKLYLQRGLCKNMGIYASNYVRENHTIEKHAAYYMELFEKAYKKVNNR